MSPVPPVSKSRIAAYTLPLGETPPPSHNSPERCVTPPGSLNTEEHCVQVLGNHGHKLLSKKLLDGSVKLKSLEAPVYVYQCRALFLD